MLTSFDELLMGKENGQETVETLQKSLESAQIATNQLISQLSLRESKEGNSKGFNELFKSVQRELDARLPYKRQRTEPSNSLAPKPWTKGELSTLIYGVCRLGEREFTDLMGQQLFLKHEFEQNSKQAGSAIRLPEKASRHSAAEIAHKWD